MLREGERLDDLQRNGYRLIQKEGVFRFGIDAVLLAGFAWVNEQERALDLGCGTGILPILLRGRTPGRSFTGLEIDPEAAGLASRSVALNGLEESIRIMQGDLRKIHAYVPGHSFHVVTSNPPYMAAGCGKTPKTAGVDAARHELLCTLPDVVKAASYALKEQGRFYLVHRPFRLAQIFEALSACRLEPKRLRLVYPKADREPNLVLVEARKGGKPFLTVEPPLIVYGPDGAYTKEILEIYGRGQEEGEHGSS